MGQPASLTTGLIAYYPLAGNANNAVGSLGHGTAVNLKPAANHLGVPNAAFEFTGVDSTIQATLPNLPVGNAPWTVSAWYKPMTRTLEPIFHNWIVSWGIEKLPISGSTAASLAVFRDLQSVFFWGSYNDYYPSYSLDLGRFYHLTCTYDGSSFIRVYVNGVLIGSKNVGVLKVNPNNNILHIGRSSNFEIPGLAGFARGVIDSVRIYNRDLPDTEVKALYEYESTPPDNIFITNGLVAYYPFNGNANDESGNFRNGKVIGAVNVGRDRFGNTGKSGEFNDAIGYVDCGVDPAFDFPSDFSICLWFKTDSSQISYLVSKYDHRSKGSYGVSCLNLIGGFVWGGNRDNFSQSNLVADYADNTWHSLVMVHSVLNGSVVYKDGISKGAIPGSVGHSQFNLKESLKIGGLGSAGLFFKGSIDDVRIYNRALSDGEVKALYDYESTSPIQSPVFVSQPVSKTVNSGDNVVLSVVLQVAGTYNYQWQLNEQNIAGATTSSLSVNNAVAGSYRYRVIVSNSAGTIISDTATLTVSTPPAPSIVTQPAPKTVQEAANVSFNVVATGQGSVVYQWQFNEQNLPGATSATLNLNGVKLNTAGRYRVLISSQYGVTISDTVTLTVNPNPPPAIVTQPVSQTVAEGTVQVLLSVTASGVGSLAYQWQINNQNISGATSSTLALNAVRPSFNGRYRVIVSSQYGVTISSEAVLSIIVFDSDSDGLSDYEELLLGTNPNKADSDGDGLSDFAEVRTHGSNPLTTDTDGDGYSDGIEVARDGNPNNRSVTPTGALAVFPAVDVEFYTLNSVKYQLEVSTDMVSWTAQGGVVVGNGGSQNHLVRASKATQFWRLKVVQ